MRPAQRSGGAVTDRGWRLGPACADAVARLSSARGHEPFLTWVAPAEGARIELSRATAASWVSKTAGLLLEEPGSGTTVGTVLAGHWTAAVVALGAWRAGCAVAPGRLDDVDVRVALEGLGAQAEERADDVLLVGAGPAALLGDTSSRSFASEVLAQPDDLDAHDPDPTALAVAVPRPGPDLSLRSAGLAGPGARRVVGLDLVDSLPGLVTLAAVMVGGGSLVAGRLGGLSADELRSLVDSERATAVVGSATALRALPAGLGVDAVAVPDPDAG